MLFSFIDNNCKVPYDICSKITSSLQLRVKTIRRLTHQETATLRAFPAEAAAQPAGTVGSVSSQSFFKHDLEVHSVSVLSIMQTLSCTPCGHSGLQVY
jgi:hypothetical protein